MARHRNDDIQSGRQEPLHLLKVFWPWLRNGLTVAFLALVLWLLVDHLQEVDWLEVRSAIRDFSLLQILLGTLFAIATYAAYSSYDLLGRYYVKHGISIARTMKIAFISCAFTLNLGAMIGSVGFRFRMYTQRGVTKKGVARIIGMSLTTNWLGYILVAGIVFATGSVVLPFNWTIGTFELRLLGALFISVVLIYFGLCHYAKRRSWTIRGQEITLPSMKMAILQLTLSSAHWLLMGGIIFSFLYTEIGYFELLGVLLISSIAGIIAHIPGALGVLEAVFIALLGNEVTPAALIAALIAYRAVFYLGPLTVALVLYLITEIAHQKAGNRP